MKYREIETPKQLMEYMNENIKYGFSSEGINYIPSNTFQDECRVKWHLSSPEDLIKNGYGHCWDQVELERDWFLKHNFKVKTYFIWFQLPSDNTYSTHTFLVYEDNDKWYYFEHSDYKNRGIYKFSTLEKAILYRKKLHIEENKNRNPVTEKEISLIHIYEYDKPEYGLTMQEFLDYILDYGKDIILPNISD